MRRPLATSTSSSTVEAFQDVEVVVSNQVGDNVGSGSIGGWLLECIDGVEAVKGVAFVDGNEALSALFRRTSVDYVPAGRARRIVVRYGVDDVSVQEHGGAVCGVEGIPDAEDHVVL